MLGGWRKHGQKKRSTEGRASLPTWLSKDKLEDRGQKDGPEGETMACSVVDRTFD